MCSPLAGSTYWSRSTGFLSIQVVRTSSSASAAFTITLKVFSGRTTTTGPFSQNP